MLRFQFLIFIFLSQSAHGLELRVGDVLLQPLDCWACSLIEEEEESIYSHIGVVIATKPEIIVAESYKKVRAISLSEFNNKTQKSQKIGVLKFRHPELRALFENQSQRLKDLFNQNFQDLSYDSEFLWNNIDAQGNEKLYCSELLSKLFQAFAGIETPIKQMHFNKNRDQWIKYFKGNVPDKKWGNSPGDFERSELFYFAGEL
jgi:hypothetical protein